MYHFIVLQVRSLTWVSLAKIYAIGSLDTGPCVCQGSSVALITFSFFLFLGPHSWNMGVPWLGVESELQQLAYTTETATAMPDLRFLCDICGTSWLCWILSPSSEARDWICILMDASRILNLLSHNGNYISFKEGHVKMQRPRYPLKQNFWLFYQ